MAHPIHEANVNSPYGTLKKKEFYKRHQIFHQESYMTNQQKMKIFTQSWQPEDSNRPLKGLVGMIHGYTDQSGWIFELNAVALAKAGFFVCALDLQGHGFSEGYPHHVPDVQSFIKDCRQYFDSTRADYPNLPHFLYGESFGGAIALLVCVQQKKAWKGLILSGPMCEISNKYKPKPACLLEKLLPVVAFVAPRLQIFVMCSAMSLSLKEEWKRKLAERTPNRRSNGKPTTGTALQFVKLSENVKNKCHELEVPLLVLHGGDDVICDPNGSKYIYESAASKDKTLKIFKGMWHLLIGEPNDSVQEVFDVVLSWIEARAEVKE